MLEALIQLRPEGMEGLHHAVGLVESLGGRVMFSYPPHALVASLPVEAIDDLRKEPGIQSADTQEIDEERLRDAPDIMRLAMIAWNEHLAKQRAPAEKPATGLPWDAPGRLAPDPPAEIQEMLRRRERDMRGGVEDEASH